MQREVDHFRVQELSGTAWAFAALLLHNEPVMRVIAGRLVEISEQFDAQALSNTAWSFAKVQLLDTPLFGVIAQQVESLR